MDKQYYNLYGGLNLQDSPETIAQTEKTVEWVASKNVEFKKGIGLVSMNGNSNVLITTLPSNTKILGGFEYIQGNSNYMVINTSEGKFYEVSATYVLSSAKKTGLNASALYSYTNWKNAVLCTNGIDTVFSYQHGGSPEVVEITDAPKGKSIAAYKNRVFIGKDSTLHYSALSDQTDWTSANDAGSITDFFNDSSDIVAIKDQEDYLAIHKASGAVYILSGDSPDNFLMQRKGSTGCKSRFGLINYDNKQWFLNGQGVYPLGAFGPLLQLKIGESISEKINTALAESDLANYFAVKNETKDQILFYCKNINDSYINKVFIYDYIKKGWYYRELNQNITYVWEFKGDIYLGTADSKIILEDYGLTLDGSSIDAFVDFPFFHFGETFKKKSCEGIWIKFDNSVNNNCQVYLRFDNDPTAVLKIYDVAVEKTDIAKWDDGFKWDDGAKFWYKIDFDFRRRSNRRFRTMQIGIKGVFAIRGIKFENIQIED